MSFSLPLTNCQATPQRIVDRCPPFKKLFQTWLQLKNSEFEVSLKKAPWGAFSFLPKDKSIHKNRIHDGLYRTGGAVGANGDHAFVDTVFDRLLSNHVLQNEDTELSQQNLMYVEHLT